MQQETHKAFLATRGLSRQRVIPTKDVNQSEWFGILPTREKECLGYSVIAEPEATSFDLNPRIDRLCFGRNFLMPTLTTEAKHWMRQGLGQEGFDNKKFSNRLMLGIEMLAVQGYPTEWLSRLKGPGFTDCCYGDLAGNAMTMQVILAVTFGVFMNMPELKIEDDGQNIDDIMKLMEF